MNTQKWEGAIQKQRTNTFFWAPNTQKWARYKQNWDGCDYTKMGEGKKEKIDNYTKKGGGYTESGGGDYTKTGWVEDYAP